MQEEGLPYANVVRFLADTLIDGLARCCEKRSLSLSSRLDSLIVSKTSLWACHSTNCNNSCNVRTSVGYLAIPNAQCVDPGNLARMIATVDAFHFSSASFIMKKPRNVICTASTTTNNAWDDSSLNALILGNPARLISANCLRWPRSRISS